MWSCSDPTMPPSCGLHATTGATGTPDSPYLCDPVFSPNMRYALVAHHEYGLVLYEYGTGTASSWAVAQELVPVLQTTDLRWGSDVVLALQSSGMWALHGFGPVITSHDVGTTNTDFAGLTQAPFRLMVTDDGLVQIVGSDGREVWVSETTTSI